MNALHNQINNGYNAGIMPFLFQPDPLGNNPGTDDGGRVRRPTTLPTLDDVTPDQYYPEDEKESITETGNSKTGDIRDNIVENDITLSNEEKERIKEDYEPDDSAEADNTSI